MNPTSASTQPQVQIDTTLPPGLSPAQRDRILAYRTAVAQGVSPDSAVALVQSLAKQPQSGGIWNGVKRLLLKPMLQAPVDLVRAASYGVGGTDMATVGKNIAMESLADQGMTPATPSSAAFAGINRLIPQDPQGRGERMVAAGVRGATGGVLLGPGAPALAAASGGLAGLGGQGTAELGGSPEAQLAVATLLGLVPPGVSAVASRMGPANQAARNYAGAVKAVGDEPVAQLEQARAMAKGDPTLQGREALGPQGQALALRVAREGGTAAEPMLNRTADQADLLAQQYGNRKSAVVAERSQAQQAQGMKVAERLQSVRDQAVKGFQQQVKQIVQSPPDAGGLAIEQALDRAYSPKVKQAYSLIDKAEVQTTPELAALMRDPNFARDWEAARTIANSRVEGPAGSRQPVAEIPPLMEDRGSGIITSLMPGEQAPTTRVVRETLPLRGYDALKQFLQKRRFDLSVDEGQRSEATALLSRLDAIIHDHVDPQVPGYQVARSTAQEYIDTRQALSFGRQLAEAPKARTATRGQVDTRNASQPDEVQSVLGDMTPDRIRVARLGYLYAKLAKIERSQTPWKEVADMSRAEGLLTPEELGQIKSAAMMAERRAKGIYDPTLQQMRTEGRVATAQAMTNDPQLQRIQERARATDQVLEAANPKTATERVGAARKILTDVFVRAMKSAARDINMATAGKSLKPAVRGELGGALSAQGPELEAVIADWIRRLSPKPGGPAQGTLSAAPAATQRRQ